MAYLISVNSGVQATSGTQSLSSLLKYSLPAIEADQVSTMSVKLVANTILEIPLTGVTRIYLLTLQASEVVDYALGTSSTTSGTAVFTTYGSNLTLRVFQGGQAATKLFLRSSVATTCEIAYGGREV